MTENTTIINNTSLVKKTNVQLVRTHLRNVKLATRTEVALATGLSVATCKNLLNEMLANGEVFKDEEKESNGGRPATQYRYNKDFIKVACIGISYDDSIKTLQSIVADSFGDIIEDTVKIYNQITYETVDASLERMIKAFPDIQAVTISIPGETYDGIVRFCDIKELQEAPLEIGLAKKYNISVNVEGITQLIAYGYYKSHIELATKSLAVILAPQNLYLGAGIIIGGQLHRGDKRLAGEISFIATDIPREEALYKMSDDTFFMNALTTTTTAIISVINPTKIVITGGAVKESMYDTLYQRCRDIVPEVFMPEIEITPDTEQFFVTGIINMALNHATSGVKLIHSDM